MSRRISALGMLSILSAASLPANATTILFNSYDGRTVYGVDGNGPLPPDGYGDQVTEIAQEFHAGGAFNTIGLALTADNPSDNQSVNVYLVADSSDAASPIQTGDFSTLTPIAAVNDNSLVATGPVFQTGGPQLTTLSITNAQIPLSANGEYWVVVVDPAGSSSFEWFANNAVAGIGTSGQYIANNSGGWGVVDPATLLPPSGQYEMVVSNVTTSAVPEPATIAVLGVGLAGLVIRRRRKPD
nr:PEP-CTERM sorting domain-containing protein [uncultured Rhodopila sp.]